MSISVEITLASVSRQIYENKIARLTGSISGDAVVTISATPSQSNKKDKVELTEAQSLSDTIENALEDYIFKMDGGLIFSSSGLGLSINTGVENVTLEFTSDHVLAVSVALPITFADIDLAKLNLPKRVKGKVSFNASLELLFVPNYKALAQKTTRQILKRTAKNILRKGGKIAQVTIRTGRKAFAKVMASRVDAFAKKFAKLSLKHGSQMAGLRAMAKGFFRKIFIALTVYDAYKLWKFYKNAKRNAISYGGATTMSVLAPEFIDGYIGTFLALIDMKDQRLRNNIFVHTTDVHRILDSLPDFHGSYETWLESKTVSYPAAEDVKKLYSSTLANGPAFTIYTRKYVDLDSTELFAEAFNTIWEFRSVYIRKDHNKARNTIKRHVNVMVDHGIRTARIAGGVAAYQDIISFLFSTGVYQDSAGDIDMVKMWEPWDAVSEIYLNLYGSNRNERYFKMKKMAADQGVLRPTFFPFG